MQELTTEEKKPKLGAEVAPITQERDITRLYSMPLLIPQDETLNLKGGYGIEALKIYEKVLENPQVRSCYQQRFRKLTKCQWEVTPASPSRADKKAADWLRELCANMPMDTITEHILYGVHYGYSIAEKLLIPDGNTISLDLSKGGIRVRNRRRFRFDTEMRPRLITINNQYEGELLPKSRIWEMSYGNDNADDPYGRGLANSLFWMDVFQRGAMRHWLNFLDNFSARNAKVTYPVGASEDEKKLALLLAQGLKAGKPSAHAEGLIAEIIEAAGSGTGNFEGLYDRCDSAIAKIILSQSGTTDNGAWAGTAESHENVADDVVASDGDMFSQSFTRHVATPLCFYNFPDAQTPICAYKTSDEEDINTRVDRDKKLFDLGVKPTPDLISKVYGDGYEYIANQTILNGAQLQALTQMIITVSQNQLPADSLVQILVNTMGVPIEAAQAIVSPIKNNPQPQNIAPDGSIVPPQIPTQGQAQNNAPQAANPEPDLTALFSETLDFASKNCSKGLACGNSCISAKKKCKKSITAQESAYASKVTGGSGGNSEEDPFAVFDNFNFDNLSGSQGDFALLDIDFPRSPATDVARRFRKDAPPPTNEEAKGLKEYTSDGFERINSALRGSLVDENERKEALELAQKADQALRALPSYRGESYRGTSLPPEVINSLKVGGTFSDKGFLSTSSDRDVAEEFALEVKGNQKPVFFSIQSKHGKDISGGSDLPSESEVLFAPNSKFKIKAVEEKDGVMYVQMAQIGKEKKYGAK